MRLILAGLAILLLAASVLRNAALASWASTDPGAAARWWPGHPAAEEALAEAAIGRAAASGQAPGQDVFERLALVAGRSPMAVTPLLAHGVAAQEAGQLKRAQRLFEIAEQRQPREFASHYFLAALHLRSGRVEDGLRELVNLARLAPNGLSSAAPMVAAFARAPENWPRMKAIFVREPALGRAVLDALAPDPANVPVLLALAQGPDREPDAPWLTTSLAAQVAAGRYREAHRLWALMSGLRGGESELLHDPRFRDVRSPPPFNWALAETAVGSAERRPGGGLQVIFYGSQSGTMARQLLLLPPGRYRLIIDSRGKLADPRSLEWILTCVRPALDIASLPAQTNGRSGVDFDVPAGCPAQSLVLEARAQDVRGDSDIQVDSVTLERVSG